MEEIAKKVEEMRLKWHGKRGGQRRKKGMGMKVQGTWKRRRPTQ